MIVIYHLDENQHTKFAPKYFDAVSFNSYVIRKLYIILYIIIDIIQADINIMFILSYAFTKNQIVAYVKQSTSIYVSKK